MRTTVWCFAMGLFSVAAWGCEDPEVAPDAGGTLSDAAAPASDAHVDSGEAGYDGSALVLDARVMPSDGGSAEPGLPDAGGPAIADAGSPPVLVDAGPPPPMMCTAADLIEQRLCGAGRACDAFRGADTTITQCRDVVDAAEGAPCSSGQCGAGMTCIGFDPSSPEAGICRRMCNSDAMCGGAACETFGVAYAAGTELFPTGICYFPCDPVSTSGCPAGLACEIITAPAPSTRRVRMCSPPASGASVGMACPHANCAPGGICAAGVCRQVCRAGERCPDGDRCTRSSPPVEVGGVEYGACL